jgi:hypothetical protein
LLLESILVSTDGSAVTTEDIDGFFSSMLGFLPSMMRTYIDDSVYDRRQVPQHGDTNPLFSQ